MNETLNNIQNKVVNNSFSFGALSWSTSFWVSQLCDVLDTQNQHIEKLEKIVKQLRKNCKKPCPRTQPNLKGIE